MEHSLNASNVKALFGIEKLPIDNRIHYLLDPAPPELFATQTAPVLIDRRGALLRDILGGNVQNPSKLKLRVIAMGEGQRLLK